MKLDSKIIGASAVLFAVGCGTPTLSAAVPACGLAGTPRDTCETRMTGKTVCHIYVGGSKAAPFVYPSELQVPKRAKRVVIVWHLLDKNAVFIDKNEGPNFTSSGSEFFDSDTTDDPDGDLTSGFPARHYRTKFRNNPLANPAKYTIKFRDDAGQIAECDPTINNSTD